jgi:hypothetical protein
MMFGVQKIYDAMNGRVNEDDERNHVLGLPGWAASGVSAVSRTGIGGAPIEMAWRGLERGEPPTPLVSSLAAELGKAVTGNTDAKRTGSTLFRDIAAPGANAAMIAGANAVPAGIGHGIPKLVAKGAAFVGSHALVSKQASEAAGEVAAGE